MSPQISAAVQHMMQNAAGSIAFASQSSHTTHKKQSEMSINKSRCTYFILQDKYCKIDHPEILKT